jgi:ATP-dependent RNA helicase DeaD
VAARGIDISHIARVINFDLPDSADVLTHRLGRTGRMGRSGEAVTLISPRDRKRWADMAASLHLDPKTESWQPGDQSVSAPPPKSDRPRSDTPPGNNSRRANDTRTGERNSRSKSPNGRGSRPNHSRSRADNAAPGSPLVEAVCEGCGAPARVAFKPSPERPAYCRECRELVTISA